MPGDFGGEQRFLFGFGVDLGVAVGGGEVGMAEPPADDVDLDAGFEDVDGGGVPAVVRAGVARAGLRLGGRSRGRASSHLVRRDRWDRDLVRVQP